MPRWAPAVTIGQLPVLPCCTPKRLAYHQLNDGHLLHSCSRHHEWQLTLVGIRLYEFASNFRFPPFLQEVFPAATRTERPQRSAERSADQTSAQNVSSCDLRAIWPAQRSPEQSNRARLKNKVSSRQLGLRTSSAFYGFFLARGLRAQRAP